MPELHRQTNINQHAGTVAVFVQGVQFVAADTSYHRLLQDVAEILFAQAHQDAVTGHGDRGIARRVGDQRILAEETAGGEGGQCVLPSALAAGHHRLALLDDVEGIAAVAFAHHFFTQVTGALLKSGEQ